MFISIQLDLITLALDYLDNELFKSSLIVYACCSPHIPKESVVLSENGALFLLDLVSYVNCQKLNGYVKWSELRVLWYYSSGAKNYKLLGIKLNWHLDFSCCPIICYFVT